MKEARLKIGLTQEEVSEQIGITSFYISHLENGASKPSLEVLVKICNALGVTSDYLLCNSVYASKDYIRDEVVDLLKCCATEDFNLISDIIKVIINNKKL